MKLSRIDQVEQVVGKSPAPRDLKVIDHIDEHAKRWLLLSQFAFIACGQAGSLGLSAAGGGEAFVSVMDSSHLLIALASIDEASIVEQDLSFGALFLIGGMDETLRVNGRVSDVTDGMVTLVVEECYLHCAKSFRRSNFWLPESVELSQSASSDFILRSTFLVLASINSCGQIDVSPKGDPKGFLIQEDDDFVYFADRPGNRRIDSFRNIIEQPSVSILALVPGWDSVLALKGTAELCTDTSLLKRFTVQGKEPKLVTKVEVDSRVVNPSKAIKISALWPSKGRRRDLKPAEIFKAHIKHSKERSLKAKVARAAVALPGAFELGLETDYKKNMY